MRSIWSAFLIFVLIFGEYSQLSGGTSSLIQISGASGGASSGNLVISADELYQSAHCSEPTKDVVDKAKNLQNVGALHVVKEICRNIATVMQGRMKHKTEGVGLHSHSAESFQSQLVVAQKQIDDVEKNIEARVKRNLDAANFARDLDDTLIEVTTGIQSCKGAIGKKTLAKKQERLEEPLQKLVTLSKFVTTDSDEKLVELEVTAIREALSTLVEMIAINTVADAEAERLVKEAMVKRRQHATARGELAKNKALHESAVEELRRLTATFEDALAANEHKLQEFAQKLKSVGVYKKSGSPCSAATREIDRLWREDNMKELLAKHGKREITDECGFRYWWDPNLSEAQKAAQKNYDELDAKKTEMLKKHKESIAPRLETIGNLHTAVLENEVDVDNIGRSVGLGLEKTMSEYKNLKPVEYSELQAMFQMERLLEDSARQMVRAAVRTGGVATLAGDIEDAVEEAETAADYESALQHCAALSMKLNSSCQSEVGLLRHLEEGVLRRVLRPPVNMLSVSVNEAALAYMNQISDESASDQCDASGQCQIGQIG